MLGGSGKDVFVLTSNSGQDVIMDFKVGQDIIQLSKNINGSGINNPGDLAGRITQDGANTVIHLDGNATLVLTDVDANAVKSHLSDYFTVH